MNKRLIIIILKLLLLMQSALGQAPYFFDKIDTTYSNTNSKMNYIFVNYSEKDDFSEKYTPNAAFYFKNVIAATDPVIDVKRSSLGFVSMQPTVN